MASAKGNMARWSLALSVLAWACTSLASEIRLDEKTPQTCSGMYSKATWGGKFSPFILTRFSKFNPKDDNNQTDPLLAFIIYEWSDIDLIGVPKSNNSNAMQYVCDDSAVDKGYCEEEKVGQYILAPNSTDLSRSVITTQAIQLGQEKLKPINYLITRTGYYCVSTNPFGKFSYEVILEFKNAYGELPGAQIPKLPFYGGLAVVYAVIGTFWAFLYVQNRRDILPVQNYITATIIFLVVEMIATWGYYDHMNQVGTDGTSKFLLTLVALLNALRNSMSFFLLLIVCMGYGVVHANLGKQMKYARILAAVHFVFGVVGAIVSGSIAPEDTGPLILLVVFPLAATLTIFYIWTLQALSKTLKDLQERKQRVKAQMYQRLWWCILTSVVVIFAFFFLNTFIFANQSDPDFVPTHWQTRWFILDGWLSLVYLGDVIFIAYIWRPTANNRRFAMSDEISQDDDGFDIASVGESIDLEEDLGYKLPPYEPPVESSNGDGMDTPKPANHSRDRSPLPAPTPQRPPKPPRESLDGDTIFAVGDDRLSDSEDGDEEERKGLTGT